MWQPPLVQSWAQSPNQVLDTAKDVVFYVLAKGDTQIITDKKGKPPETSGGQQSRRNCKSQTQRALENPGTIDPTEGRVESRKKKKMDTTDDN